MYDKRCMLPAVLKYKWKYKRLVYYIYKFIKLINTKEIQKKPISNHYLEIGGRFLPNFANFNFQPACLYLEIRGRTCTYSCLNYYVKYKRVVSGVCD